MKICELKSKIDRCNYGEEISSELESIAKENNIVVAFGYSDDGVELRGAIDEELSAWGGKDFYIKNTRLHSNECEDDNCPNFDNGGALKISALWQNENSNGLAWSFETDIPHEKFIVMEDGGVWSEGIIFSLNNLTK